MREPKIKVTKLDAARRQLRVAIRLWFMGSDPVAVHTLASAAHEIIHTLFKRKGLHDLMFDSDRIKDKYRSDWAKVLTKDATFFKHARRDPDGEIEFNTGTNLAVLFAGVQGLHKMGEPKELEDSAFMYWLRIEHPRWFLKGAPSDSVQVQLDKLKGIPKNEFFQAFEFLWRKQHPHPPVIGRGRLPC